MEMCLIGYPGGHGCLGTQGLLQHVSSMTSMGHTLETTSQGNTSPLATGREKSHQCHLFIQQVLTEALLCCQAWCTLRTNRRTRYHAQLGADGKEGGAGSGGKMLK